ncbi:MAG: hypothetical protein NVS1B14_09480 [Vulcanimicrobiaceae bacterium]
MQSFADSLSSRGYDGVMQDVKGLARRRPGLFLLGAAAAGFGVARLARAAASDQMHASDNQPTELNTDRVTQGLYSPATPASQFHGQSPAFSEHRSTALGSEI